MTPLRVQVSDALRRSVAGLDASAERWLDEVPARIVESAGAWDLELGAQLHHDGAASIVIGVSTRDGSPAILKLSVPHEDARGEATALRFWDGRGAVRLLRCTPDGFTLLLERCRPGHDLWRIPVADQIDVVTELLPRLWLTPTADTVVRELADTADDWERRMRREPDSFDAPAEVIARAGCWARELREDQPRRLLHGDLNPGNVLAVEGGTWLAIDPKPWMGDPAFDLAQLLVNWARVDGGSRDEAASATLQNAERLAANLSLDVGRVLRWAVVKAIGWDAGREHIVVLDAAARKQGDTGYR